MNNTIKVYLKTIIRIFRSCKNRIKFFKIRKNKGTYEVLKDACDGLDIEISDTGTLELRSPCFTNTPVCHFYVRSAAKLTIGHDTYFNSNCTIVSRSSIEIGDNCLFGPNVYICDHDHLFDKEKVYRDQYKCEPIKIGNNCWIGAGTIILKGAIIEDNSIIGAGSVITSRVPSDTVCIQKRDIKLYNR